MMDENTLLDILVTTTVCAMSAGQRTPVGSRVEARQLPTGKEWTEANGIPTNKVSNTK
ncbi:hypothetical protein ACERII_25295 [Evansella sp. AB-rgal1]|uniref:hypothetical protein n=1 Tax=Evansella sp. AB-rgal1 TaxID=3242696 RepID=UPI00359EAADD